MNGLHHLVEAATALTQLVSSVPTNQNQSGRNSTHAISDDEESSKKGFSDQSNEQTNNAIVQTQYSLQQNPSQPHAIITGNQSGNTSNISNAVHGSTSARQEPILYADSAPKHKDSPSLSNSSTTSTSTVLNSEAVNTSSSNNHCQREIFPQRLMRILSDTSITDIITWLPHGRSFVIVQPEVLAEKILPKFFPESCSSSNASSGNGSSPTSSCKYPSFTRKLNRWGFRQVTRGPDSGAFHHKFFRRDDPVQCRQMICQRSRRRKVDDKRGVLDILPRNASTSVNKNSVQGHAQIAANGQAHHLQPMLARTVTETGAIVDNRFPNAAGISNMQMNATNRARPLPTMHNYRIRTPPSMYPQTNTVPTVNMNMNVDPVIVSTTASPTPKKDMIMAASSRAPATKELGGPDISTLKNSASRGYQLHETQSQPSLEARALLQHKLAMNAVFAATATAALKRQQPQKTELALPTAAATLFSSAPPTTTLIQQLEGHIALNPSINAMIPQLAATFNSNQLLMQGAQPVVPSAKGAVSISGLVASSSAPSSRASPSTITSAPSTAATSPITAPEAIKASAATSSGDESVRSSQEGSRDKSDAEKERIESAKSLLYNAYLKALG